MNEEKQINLEEKKENKKIDKTLKWIALVLLGLIIIILIFSLGMMVGGMKARFSFRWAENYHKNFAGPRQGFLRDWRRIPFGPADFIEGHGAFGEIIELKDNSFVIKGRGGIEKVIVITKETVIKKGIKNVKNGLKIGDYVVIIGSPNDEGQIEAKLIRVFDKDFEGPPFPFKGRSFFFF